MDVNNGRNFKAPYVFREYPKWVTLVDGTQMLVQDAEEESVLTGQPEQNSEPDTLEEMEAERRELMARLREKGLVIHHRTGLDTLRAKVAALKE